MTTIPTTHDSVSTGDVIDLGERREQRDLLAAVETLRLLVRAVGRPTIMDDHRDSRVAEIVRTGIATGVAVPDAVAETLRRVRADVEEMLGEHLDAEERDVLRARFGLTDGTIRSQVDVGAALHLSPPTVASAESRALSRLRHPAFADILEACLGS